jgi:prepilin-type N-terminal cleavage/methylation domain-containing protein
MADYMKQDKAHRGIPGRINSVDHGKFPHFEIAQRFTERQKGGFTLIELLAVVFILAVLAVTLLPALAGTRQNSEVVQCLSNQRQLSVAWMMYARDNNDYLVPNRGLNGAGGSFGGGPQQSSRFQVGGPNADWCPGNMEDASEAGGGSQFLGGDKYSEWIQAGLLYAYINNINVFHCPADHNIVPHGGGGFTGPALRTYSMNCWVAPMDNPGYVIYPWKGLNGYLAYSKLSSFTRPRPAKTWVFIEESPYTIDDAFFAVDPTTPTLWYNSPAVLHGNASVLAYADGHTDAHRWTDNNMIHLNSMTPAYASGGDLAWFIEASTAPTSASSTWP